ncbi:phosphoglycerate transport regulatory protein PgtC [Aliiroseovarius zhejiangensis]|uniref:Phosphoglycerate transport regulatory protein PgtC n=2 Tax=Aliiroseovarius zhejiangensis TaxID=1632025 RepID=A0ABQ3IRQ7_9RHOB|nr:phosphoglycerate transport regulatory protein PgtC [Aliiroseovarius zhejiangensis]
MQYLRFALMMLALLCTRPASAQELRVLTSFPPEFSAAYTKMWDARDPTTEIRVLNKNTVAAIDEILRGNIRGFDVFWSSSPEAFELLQRNDAFAQAGICGAKGAASVAPFALSSVGWARRSDSTLFMPANWNDLLRPLYRDKIAMARPARSGSTHMLVEQILLVRGWEEGWRFLLELSGNLSTLTARSYGVPDGLINERFQIGLTIDFLSQSKSDKLDFRYGRPIVLAAARVGILRGGQAPHKACEFVRMLLSREGQITLLEPEISRIPFDPDLRAEVEEQLPPDVIDALKLAWFDYDARQSSNRYWSVNTLFDILITDRLVERRNLWRRFHALDGKVSPSDLIAPRLLLTAVPVSEDEALKASLQRQDEDQSKLQSGSGASERELVRMWRARTAAQLVQADQALRRLEQQASQ